MATADNLIDLIRDLIRDELKNRDNTELCRIQSVNSASDTLNISLFTDLQTVIPNIVNASKYIFQAGDVGVLFKIGGQLNNAFVIAKAGLPL